MLRTFFFFNDTATTEIYTLSLHDALPISGAGISGSRVAVSLISLAVHSQPVSLAFGALGASQSVYSNFLSRGKDVNLSDRKSTRLNSSHLVISYAVFCLKKNNSPVLIINR